MKKFFLMTCVMSVAVLFLTWPALGAEKVYKIRIGHVAPPITVQHYNADFFKKFVEARSDGRIKVTIYPTAQLGGERVMANPFKQEPWKWHC